MQNVAGKFSTDTQTQLESTDNASVTLIDGKIGSQTVGLPNTLS